MMNEANNIIHFTDEHDQVWENIILAWGNILVATICKHTVREMLVNIERLRGS